MSLLANPSEAAQNMQYEGSISTDGKFHGRGSIVCVPPRAAAVAGPRYRARRYSNGERYAGEWAHGQRHGRGASAGA
jgi:hypothetical protein